MTSRAAVLVTGMSGAGKSTALRELARRGHRVVDTDDGDWAYDAPLAEGPGWERLWREDRIEALLREHVDGALFVSGCVANQGLFYDRFTAVALLSAPVDVLLQRLATRTTNPYGKLPEQRDAVLREVAEVEPLLRAGATVDIDARVPPARVADALVSLTLR